MAPTAAAPSSSSSAYLLPLPTQIKLDDAVARELAGIEAAFALDGDLLQRTVKQMLWEFGEGLSKHVDSSNKDTFLPMM